MSERGSVTVAIVCALLSLALAGVSVKVALDGQFIIGIAALIGAIVAAYNSLRNTKELKQQGHKIDAVQTTAEATHREVKTINAQSIAQLADSTETRRIEEKVEHGTELTETEQSHIDSVDQAGNPTEERR